MQRYSRNFYVQYGKASKYKDAAIDFLSFSVLEEFIMTGYLHQIKHRLGKQKGDLQALFLLGKF